MAFEDLYQEIILDHYRHPHNFGSLAQVSSAVEHENPVCGDHLKLMIVTDAQGNLSDIRFEGHGCAISMASASMMSDEVKGKALSQVKNMITQFLQAMRGELPPDILEEWGDLGALKGVVRFPVRVKCATLAWHALLDAIVKESQAAEK
jgi:nitrogen fixation NifU-like protein